MELRPYETTDFDTLAQWVTEERDHALWCGNLIPYPLARETFEAFLRELAERTGDRPFAALTEEGQMVGFFSFSLNPENREGMLKFVVIDHRERNRGYGRAMVDLAVRYAFREAGAEAVHLNVYTENPGARRCYRKAGFRDRTLTEGDFPFREERWGKYNMILRKEDTAHP